MPSVTAGLPAAASTAAASTGQRTGHFLGARGAPSAPKRANNRQKRSVRRATRPAMSPLFACTGNLSRRDSVPSVPGLVHLLRLFRRRRDTVRHVLGPECDDALPSYARCQRPDSDLSQWSVPSSARGPSNQSPGPPRESSRRASPWDALRAQQQQQQQQWQRRAPPKPEQLRSQCSQFKARARRLPTPLLMDSLKRCARRLYARTRLRAPSLASDNTWASSASRRRRRRRTKKPPALRLDGKAVLLGAPALPRPGRKPEVTARLWLKFFELQRDARRKGLRNERLLDNFRDDLKTEHMWSLVSPGGPDPVGGP